MNKFNPRRHWWMVVTVAAVVGVAALVITDEVMGPDALIGVIVFLVLIGASFCWVYFVDQAHFWWAIIPGLAPFALLAAMIPDIVFGSDPKNDWLNVAVLGGGMAVIGLGLKRIDAKGALYAIATITFIVAILMAQFAWILKGVLIAVAVMVLVLFFWRNRERPVKTG